MSLRVRIALLSASAVAVTVLIMLAATLWVARSQARASLDDQLRERASTTEILGVSFSVSRGRGRFNLEDTLIQIIDAKEEKLFASSVELPVSKKDAEVATRRKLEAWSDVKVQGVNLRVYTSVSPRLQPGLAVMVAQPLTEIDDTITRMRNSMGLIALLGVAGSGLLGFVVAGRSIRPLSKLSEAAGEVAVTQDLEQRIEPEGAGELSDLANSFNAMLEALAMSRNQQQQLVADASHELRTPLTSLRTNIELLLREQAADRPMLTDEDREQLLQDVKLELTDLTELVAEMVALASYEFEDAEAEPLALDEIVTTVAERYRHRSNREIVCQLQPCTVIAPQSLVQRAVSNLIDNAIKWGPPDMPIEVTVTASEYADYDEYASETGGELTVRDYGPGISPSHRKYVFERFYRAPEARSMPGSGLGLAIVAQVAQAVGGLAEVLDTDGEGATVRLRFPPEPADPEDSTSAEDETETETETENEPELT